MGEFKGRGQVVDGAVRRLAAGGGEGVEGGGGGEDKDDAGELAQYLGCAGRWRAAARLTTRGPEEAGDRGRKGTTRGRGRRAAGSHARVAA